MKKSISTALLALAVLAGGLTASGCSGTKANTAEPPPIATSDGPKDLKAGEKGETGSGGTGADAQPAGSGADAKPASGADAPPPPGPGGASAPAGGGGH